LKNLLSLSQIPTPATPDLSSKIPFIAKYGDEEENSEIAGSLSAKYGDKVLRSLDKVPTPPLPLPHSNEYESVSSDVDATSKDLSANVEFYLESGSKSDNMSISNSSTSTSFYSVEYSSSSSNTSKSTSPHNFADKNELKVVLEDVERSEDDGEEKKKSDEIDRSINMIKKLSRTRCRVLNYFLFPELKDKHHYKTPDYENELMKIIQKSCINTHTASTN